MHSISVQSAAKKALLRGHNSPSGIASIFSATDVPYIALMDPPEGSASRGYVDLMDLTDLVDRGQLQDLAYGDGLALIAQSETTQSWNILHGIIAYTETHEY